MSTDDTSKTKQPNDDTPETKQPSHDKAETKQPNDDPVMSDKSVKKDKTLSTKPGNLKPAIKQTRTRRIQHNVKVVDMAADKVFGVEKVEKVRFSPVRTPTQRSSVLPQVERKPGKQKNRKASLTGTWKALKNLVRPKLSRKATRMKVIYCKQIKEFARAVLLDDFHVPDFRNLFLE